MNQLRQDNAGLDEQIPVGGNLYPVLEPDSFLNDDFIFPPPRVESLVPAPELREQLPQPPIRDSSNGLAVNIPPPQPQIVPRQDRGGRLPLIEPVEIRPHRPRKRQIPPTPQIHPEPPTTAPVKPVGPRIAGGIAHLSVAMNAETVADHQTPPPVPTAPPEDHRTVRVTEDEV